MTGAKLLSGAGKLVTEFAGGVGTLTGLEVTNGITASNVNAMEQNLQASLLQASIDFPEGVAANTEADDNTSTAVAIGEDETSGQEHGHSDVEAAGQESDDVTEP
ncbi:MAG: hypothetical protein EBU08_17945, partial [Micrococcales bacterium]|nr:hypothetical protein [Micrococcales bacterium]